MVWNQLKHHTCHLNVYTSQPAKVLNLIQEVCHSKITTEHWSNYIKHVINKEHKFKVMDHILVNDIEPLIMCISLQTVMIAVRNFIKRMVSIETVVNALM